MACTSLSITSGTLKSTTNSLYQRTYSVGLEAEFDATPTIAQVKSASHGGLSVPGIGAYFDFNGETDLGSYCQSVAVSEIPGTATRAWEIALEYGPIDYSQFPANPVDWPLKVSTQVVQRERAMDFDTAGVPIRNSAKQRFGDPITHEFTDFIITCKRNERVSVFDLGLAYNYQNKINNATWNNFPAKTVLCRSITVNEEQYDSTARVWYYTVTYVFETNRDTWRKKVLDQGFCELDTSSPPRLKRILGPDGQPLDEPVPLDGSGRRLATNAAPVILTFDMIFETDFSIFDIDLSNRLGL
jgi:hypothetical protein